MAFDIKNYLRDIDAEEYGLRQQISLAQVRIQQLQDMRVLMMQREEQRAEQAGRPSPFGTLHNAEIAVRRPAVMLEDGALSHAAKTGTPPPAEPKKPYDRAAPRKRRLKLVSYDGGSGAAMSELRYRTMLALDGEPEGLTSDEIANWLGFAPGAPERKTLQNTLFSMRNAGDIEYVPGTETPGQAMNYSRPSRLTPQGVTKLGNVMKKIAGGATAK
jgi:hypothetical protein